MGKDSAIQWTDYTWNIARGCSKVDADCKFCYMYRDSFDGHRYNPREVVRAKTVFNLPLKIKETKSKVWDGPPLVFTSSLTDVFHEAIDSYRNEMWDIIRKCPHLIFQILTKRPERIELHLPPDWCEGWDNVWLGTSVGSDDAIKRITDLIQVPAKCRFVSFEPLHGPVSNFDISTLVKIDWVIIGGESGNDNGKYQYRPCKLEWMEDITNDFRVTAKIFVKQMGTYLSKQMMMSDRHGGNINEFPQHLRLREFPKVNKAVASVI